MGTGAPCSSWRGRVRVKVGGESDCLWRRHASDASRTTSSTPSALLRTAILIAILRLEAAVALRLLI